MAHMSTNVSETNPLKKLSTIDNIKVSAAISLVILLWSLSEPIHTLYSSNFSEISTTPLGDDFFAIIILVLANIFTYFSKNFFNSFWFLISSYVVGAICFFPSLSVLSSEYANYLGIILLLVLYVVIAVTLILLAFQAQILIRVENKIQKLLSIFSLILVTIASILLLFPTKKVYLKAINGGQFEASGTSEHIYYSGAFSELGLAYKYIIVGTLLALVTAQVLQLLGFKFPSLANLILFLPLILMVVTIFQVFGTVPFEQSDGWSSENLLQFKPTRTTSGTVSFYSFVGVIIILMANSLVGYVFESTRAVDKKTS
jgi:hypothetical protein